jgi:6-phosphogluconolactonase
MGRVTPADASASRAPGATRLVAGPEELGAELVELVAHEARVAIAGRGRFVLALSGGSAAETLLPHLVRAPLDVERLEVFWADERAVPESSPESNTALARRAWLDPAGVPAERIHRMPGDAPDLDRAAERHAAALVALAGDPPRLDLALLGVGPDGHVASLFPGASELTDARRHVLVVRDSPKPPPVRLTLSLPVLAASRLVVVAALGAAKAPAIAAAWRDPSSALPLALLHRRAGRIRYLLDPPAARDLA